MTADATIDYDSLQTEALRGLVKTVLLRVAKSGLPGEHHLYISFDVRAPGVILSKRLREKYPNEMTIVLQHRFWDLAVSDDRFEVKLTFDGIPERLVVPFAAIRVFLDPSVRYVLHFEDFPVGEDSTSDGAGEAPDSPTARPKRSRSSRPRVRSEGQGKDAAGAGLTAVQPPPPAVLGKPAAVPNVSKIKPAPAPAVATSDAGAPAPVSAGGEDARGDEGAEKPAAPATAQVVSLDAFRKK